MANALQLSAQCPINRMSLLPQYVPTEFFGSLSRASSSPTAAWQQQTQQTVRTPYFLGVRSLVPDHQTWERRIDLMPSKIFLHENLSLWHENFQIYGIYCTGGTEMPQSHTWKPLSMCHQNSARGQPENSLHQERTHAEWFCQSKCLENRGKTILCMSGQKCNDAQNSYISQWCERYVTWVDCSSTASHILFIERGVASKTSANYLA